MCRAATESPDPSVSRDRRPPVPSLTGLGHSPPTRGQTLDRTPGPRGRSPTPWPTPPEGQGSQEQPPRRYHGRGALFLWRSAGCPARPLRAATPPPSRPTMSGDSRHIDSDLASTVPRTGGPARSVHTVPALGSQPPRTLSAGAHNAPPALLPGAADVARRRGRPIRRARDGMRIVGGIACVHFGCAVPRQQRSESVIYQRGVGLPDALRALSRRSASGCGSCHTWRRNRCAFRLQAASGPMSAGGHARRPRADGSFLQTLRRAGAAALHRRDQNSSDPRRRPRMYIDGLAGGRGCPTRLAGLDSTRGSPPRENRR